MSLWNATLARISSTLLSRDWTLASNMLGSGVRCARFVCPFYGDVVLVRRLGTNPLSWVVGKTQDPLQKSHIPGHNVGKLMLLLYSIVLPGYMFLQLHWTLTIFGRHLGTADPLFIFNLFCLWFTHLFSIPQSPVHYLTLCFVWPCILRVYIWIFE